MGRLVLILGGARSGKSHFAEQLARERGGDRVLFVATAEVRDEEMRARVEKHRRERPAAWRTVEAPRGVGQALRREVHDAAVALVDCMTLLVANVMGDAPDPFAEAIAAQVQAEVDALIAAAQAGPAEVIVVSNEVGLGLVPANPLGRAYRDLLGQANQALARAADEVYFLVAGIPIRVK